MQSVRVNQNFQMYRPNMQPTHSLDGLTNLAEAIYYYTILFRDA